MEVHRVRTHPAAARLPREAQLAWKLATFAAAAPLVGTDPDVAEMVACRLVDNVAVALAALDRAPVAAARAMALAHPRTGGSTLLGLPTTATVHAEWGAWANGTAVRELDFHDTFLAADYAHPADSIPPLVAVAQQKGVDGERLLAAIAAAYEVHVSLVKGMCLHAQKKDHVAHLAPAIAAGLGALLGLEAPVVYHAINQAVHLGFSTRQSRKGEITSWKASAPAWAGKLAIEAVDRAMRGEGAPNPIYEGEDGVIAWMLAGPDAEYAVPLPRPGERPRGILETYPKAHAAEYQAQALIDLAFDLRRRVDPPVLARVREVVVHASHHTHTVIGSGSNDPEKYDPDASRETLDHSVMFILAVALEDGRWHHVESYTPERAHRPSTVALWRKIRTEEDPAWTARYHPDPAQKAFGGRVDVELDDGTVATEERLVADAHPNGRRPWRWPDYLEKLEQLAGGRLPRDARERFVDRAARLGRLSAEEVRQLNPALPPGAVAAERHRPGIF
ncbi:MAG: MmgE/PrpD family protein [Candidatus Rokuibacteriota bacterium]